MSWLKSPLSRSAGGGRGPTRRLLGVVALSAVLVGPTATAFAGQAFAAGPTAGASAPASATQAKTTLKVVVIGDSYTSGEGADPSTYHQVVAPAMTPDGIPYQAYQVDPAHQSSTAPTLQALNQIQAANPNVDLQVSFVPVSGATRDSLYQTTRPGTPFEQPPQINAVKDADVVIVGIGGNDARFTDWIRTVLGSSEATSAQAFPGFMQQFNDGTYLNNQVNLLNDISGLAAPNATIISLGYPKAMPAQIPNSSFFWSPVSWSTISQGEADMSNQLASTLSINNQDASFIAAGQHPQQQFLYADVTNALQGHELFTSQEGLNGVTPSNPNGSYHPNTLGQQLLGSVLQPYVEQAVNDQLGRLGIQGAQNVPVITPTFASQWNLRIQMPLQMQQLDQNQPATPDQTAPSVPAQLPPAQDWPNPSDPAKDKPADQSADKPADQPADKPADDKAVQGPTVDKPVQGPTDDKPATPPADTGQPAGPDQPAPDQSAPAQAPADTQAPAGSSATAPGADTPAAPADTSGAAPGTPAAPADTPAGTTGAAAPGDTSAPDATPATPPQADTPAAPDTAAAPGTVDTPATPPAGDTPASPGTVDTPATPPAGDTPATPGTVDTPAPGTVDTPAAPPAVDTPAAPPAAAPPAAPPVVDAPVAPAAPPPVVEPPAPPPAPVIIDPPPPPAPAPVIAPPPPVITPVEPPVDTGTSSLSGDTGSGSLDGAGSGLGIDSGVGSTGIDSGSTGLGSDAGGIETGDSGGGDGGGD